MGKYLVFPVILLFLLTGCAKEQKDKVNIVLAHWGNVGEVNFFKDLIKDFEQKNPDIKVTRIHVPRDYYEKVLTMMAGGNPPDVFEINVDRIGDFISRDALIPLDAYIERSKELKKEDFFSENLFNYKYDGKIIGKGNLYGLPKDFSPGCIFYNKDIFDKYKVPYPDPNWTWNDFLSIAKKLTKVDEKSGRTIQYGVYVDMGDLATETLLPWIYQNGGQMFSDDGTKCLLNSNSAKEAIQFVVDLTLKHKVTPGVSETREQGIEIAFSSGRVAMTVWGANGRWLVPVFEERLENIRWWVAPLPKGKRKYNMNMGPCGYSITKQSKNPEASWRLLEFLVGEKGQRITGEKGWNIPSMKRVVFSDAFLYNPLHPKGLNKIFIDELDYTYSRPLSPYIPWGELIIHFKKEIDLVNLGQKSVNDAMDEITHTVNELIDKRLHAKGGK